MSNIYGLTSSVTFKVGMVTFTLEGEPNIWRMSSVVPIAFLRLAAQNAKQKGSMISTRTSWLEGFIKMGGTYRSED
jgi:hypothetical protein